MTEAEKPWEIDYLIANQTGGFVKKPDLGTVLESRFADSPEGLQSLDVLQVISSILAKVATNAPLTFEELRILNTLGEKF